jgi:hypothetical protein
MEKERRHKIINLNEARRKRDLAIEVQAIKNQILQKKPENINLKSAEEVLAQRAVIQEYIIKFRPPDKTEMKKFDTIVNVQLEQIGIELGSAYAYGSDHDRLILDYYNATCLTPDKSQKPPGFRLSPKETRDFLIQIRAMSNEEILNETKKLKDVEQKYKDRYQKKLATMKRKAGLKNSHPQNDVHTPETNIVEIFSSNGFHADNTTPSNLVDNH